MYDLERFLVAQEKYFPVALQEIKAGRKESHWMWFIFPQLKGLGFSSKAKFYGISGKEEALAYWEHPVLRSRLLEITSALLNTQSCDAEEVMGYPDDLKLQSCMTLFAMVTEENVFYRVLDKFFGGNQDEKTQKLFL